MPLRATRGTALLSSVWLLAGPLRAAAAPFAPRSWDEAYVQAEATLARMDEDLLHISGLCAQQSFVNGLLFQRRGVSSTGSPRFGVAGYHLYHDPSCGAGDAAVVARRHGWVLSTSPPGQGAAQSGACAGDDLTAPNGTYTWEVRCEQQDSDFRNISVNLDWAKSGEKLSLLRGVGWEKLPGKWYTLRKGWYIGNVPAIPRLGIPSLNMMDAASGFRTVLPELVGTVTAWPCLLAVAATWDPRLAREYAEALGREFAGKGANGILGPSIEVHRVARGGRNFEYLSGEDPYLGARLAAAYVQGVQSQGVFAVMKHWVFNQQETNRGTESSIVDNKTAWELYYPPFQAAIDAGVSAAMCSYNKVGGDFACSNERQLSLLHNRLGFRGFVQSDWWASHSNSLSIGLDQEMPGRGAGGEPGKFHAEYFDAQKLDMTAPSSIDTAARRILAVIHRMNLSSDVGCAPPACEEWFRKNVTTPEHISLARRVAARSIVLLKNSDVLPLSPDRVSTIAIIGYAANASSYDPNGGNWARGDYYSGGGSGHVASDQVITPLAGLQSRAAELGINVVLSVTNEVDAALAAANESDVAIVVAATTSGEGRDRATLQLDGGVDATIEAVSGLRPTVVLAQVPGAVLMPWRDSVDSILAMFLGGQETGSAWADVVFGDTAPTGRLPVMMPATAADTVEPAASRIITYTEGLATSYRNKTMKAAFPFGHGLTYTTFEYGPAEQLNCTESDAGSGAASAEDELCIRIEVRNSGGNGSLAAPTLAQLYLELPAEAGQPTAVLKGFEWTRSLAPGEAENITFALRERDLSYFNATADAWVMAHGHVAVHIGESASDIRQALGVQLARSADDHDHEPEDTKAQGPSDAQEERAKWNLLWLLFQVLGGVTAVAAVGLSIACVVRRKTMLAEAPREVARDGV